MMIYSNFPQQTELNQACEYYAILSGDRNCFAYFTWGRFSFSLFFFWFSCTSKCFIFPTTFWINSITERWWVGRGNAAAAVGKPGWAWQLQRQLKLNYERETRQQQQPQCRLRSLCVRVCVDISVGHMKLSRSHWLILSLSLSLSLLPLCVCGVLTTGRQLWSSHWPKLLTFRIPCKQSAMRYDALQLKCTAAVTQLRYSIKITLFNPVAYFHRVFSCLSLFGQLRSCFSYFFSVFLLLTCWWHRWALRLTLSVTIFQGFSHSFPPFCRTSLLPHAP